MAGSCAGILYNKFAFWFQKWNHSYSHHAIKWYKLSESPFQNSKGHSTPTPKTPTSRCQNSG